MRILIHISDLHFGRFESQSIEPMLAVFIKINPDLIVISGDLTQRARTKEFLEAKEFLKRLKADGFKIFAVPGNHDIEPHYKPLSRVFRPFEKYKKYISKNLEPRYIDEEVAIFGINTVLNRTIENGKVSDRQLQKAEDWLKTIPKEVVKIFVSHHPLDVPVVPKMRRLVRKARETLNRLSKHAVDIYLSGHYHHSSSIDTKVRYKIDNYSAIAVQAGTLSKRQKGELSSFNVLEIDGKNKVIIKTYLFEKEAMVFKMSSTKTYKPENGQWQSVLSSVDK